MSDRRGKAIETLSQERDTLRAQLAAEKSEHAECNALLAEAQAAMAQAAQAQLDADMNAICYWCGHKSFEPALWDDEYDAYRHANKFGGKSEHCDASLLLLAWTEVHTQAVRA